MTILTLYILLGYLRMHGSVQDEAEFVIQREASLKGHNLLTFIIPIIHFIYFFAVLLCRRFCLSPFWSCILSPFCPVAVLTFAVLVCRRFDRTPFFVACWLKFMYHVQVEAIFVKCWRIVTACQWLVTCVLPAASAKESTSSAVLPATPSTPVISHTPVLTSVSETVVAVTKPDTDMQDTAGDLHSNLLRTITQLMQQQQQQPPQNQVIFFS